MIRDGNTVGRRKRETRPAGTGRAHSSQLTSEKPLHSTATTPPQTRAIVIRFAGERGYAITVEPPLAWASYDTHRPSIRDARRCADSLRVVTSLRIRDEAVDAA